MRLVLNIVLFAIIGALIYLIYGSIKDPIVFEAAHTKRERAVVSQLEKIRTSQEIYKSVTGRYADSFDSLKYVLKTGNVSTYKIIGDLDNENVETKIDTIYTPAIDTLRSLGVTSIDSLDFVPYGKEGAQYFIDADTLTYQQTLVNVVEVGIRRSDYMGPFADPKYKKYDNNYDPNSIIKFGDMNSPNTSGNWR